MHNMFVIHIVSMCVRVSTHTICISLYVCMYVCMYNLVVMSLECGRRLGYLERTHACTRKSANFMQKQVRPGVEPRTFLLQVNVLAIVPPPP